MELWNYGIMELRNYGIVELSYSLLACRMSRVEGCRDTPRKGAFQPFNFSTWIPVGTLPAKATPRLTISNWKLASTLVTFPHWQYFHISDIIGMLCRFCAYHRSNILSRHGAVRLRKAQNKRKSRQLPLIGEIFKSPPCGKSMKMV